MTLSLAHTKRKLVLNISCVSLSDHKHTIVIHPWFLSYKTKALEELRETRKIAIPIGTSNDFDSFVTMNFERRFH